MAGIFSRDPRHGAQDFFSAPGQIGHISERRRDNIQCSITATKRRRIILAARHYLVGKPECDCRFDCVLLDALDEKRIEWIKNAFSADD
jgi:Holliday junction resolvase-like predicted endonuclease